MSPSRKIGAGPIVAYTSPMSAPASAARPASCAGDGRQFNPTRNFRAPRPPLRDRRLFVRSSTAFHALAPERKAVLRGKCSKCQRRHTNTRAAPKLAGFRTLDERGDFFIFPPNHSAFARRTDCGPAVGTVAGRSHSSKGGSTSRRVSVPCVIDLRCSLASALSDDGGAIQGYGLQVHHRPGWRSGSKDRHQRDITSARSSALLTRLGKSAYS